MHHHMIETEAVDIMSGSTLNLDRNLTAVADIFSTNPQTFQKNLK